MIYKKPFKNVCILLQVSQSNSALHNNIALHVRAHLHPQNDFFTKKKLFLKKNRPCTWISLLSLLGLLSTAIKTFLILSPRASFPLFQDFETFENIITLSLVYRFPDEVHALHTVFFSHNK